MLTQASSSESTCKRSSAGDTVAAPRAAAGAVSEGRAARVSLAGCRGAGELAAGGRRTAGGGARPPGQAFAAPDPSHPVMLIELQVAGHAAHDATVEYAAGELVKAVGLESLQVAEIDLGEVRKLQQRDAAQLALAPEVFAKSRHGPVPPQAGKGCRDDRVGRRRVSMGKSLIACLDGRPV